MLGSVWIIRRGPEGAREFVRIVDEAVTWVSDRADAEPFDTKADALKVAEVIHADTGAEIAVYPLDGERAGPGPDRPAVHDDSEARKADQQRAAIAQIVQGSTPWMVGADVKRHGLVVVGAAKPALIGRRVRIHLLDEVDAYPTEDAPCS